MKVGGKKSEFLSKYFALHFSGGGGEGGVFSMAEDQTEATEAG